jgi:hypothetical protein
MNDVEGETVVWIELECTHADTTMQASSVDF